MRYNFNLYRICGQFGRERLTIKRFTSSLALYQFMQKAYTGRSDDWKECHGSDFDIFKPGVYANAGGVWCNVRKLDASLLAHI